jgi:hypothetical protein
MMFGTIDPVVLAIRGTLAGDILCLRPSPSCSLYSRDGWAKPTGLRAKSFSRLLGAVVNWKKDPWSIIVQQRHELGGSSRKRRRLG